MCNFWARPLYHYLRTRFRGPTVAVAVAVAVAGTLLVPAASAATTVEEIDRVAEAAVQLAARRVPDDAATLLAVLPFATDSGDRTQLGARLHGAVHLALLQHFATTEVEAVRDPTVSVDAAQFPYAIAAEIQPFRESIRIVLKLLRAGTLRDGATVDLAATDELVELLATVDAQPPIVDTAPRQSDALDPFEPDDVPGFEVTVDLEEQREFLRALTRGDRDRFSFYLPNPDTVVLEVATEIDTQLLLYLEGDRIPFSVNDDRDGGGGSQLEVDLADGWYVAEVVGFSEAVVGPYLFRIVVGSAARAGAQAPGEAGAGGRGTDGGAAAGPGRSPGSAASRNPESIGVGERQDRSILGSGDWVDLMTSTPAFYLIEARSFGGGLELSLHRERGGPSFLESASGFSGAYRGVGLFVGGRAVVAQVRSASGRPLEYNLTLRRFTPQRMFADNSDNSVEMDSGLLLHTLRIFREDRYALATGGVFGDVAVRVFSVPDMQPLTPRPHPRFDGMHEFSLTPGDYLVELTAREPDEVARVCWTTSGSALQCVK